MLAINTNLRAQFSHAALSMIERRQAVSMEQLSTGKRINSAKDDAAGMAIAARMSALIRGTNQAMKNANDGINLIQTADGAVNEITQMIQRMRELAVQASNATFTPDQRMHMDLEYQQLKREVVTISGKTQWNGMSILNGTAGTQAAPQPLYKTTSTPRFAAPLSGHSTVPAALRQDADSVSDVANLNGEGFRVAGRFSLKIETGRVKEALFTTEEGVVHSLTGAVNLSNTEPGTYDVSVSANQLVSSGLGFLAGKDITFNIQDQSNQTVLLEQPKLETNAAFVQSGTLSVKIDSTASGVKEASYRLFDGREISIDPDAFVLSADHKTLTLSRTSPQLTDELRSTLSEDLRISAVRAWQGEDAFDISIARAKALGTLKSGDLIINDIVIKPLGVLHDKLSPAANAMASAIQKAEQINEYSPLTGVTAVVNANDMAGESMTLQASEAQGNLIINGYRTSTITSSNALTAITRERVVEAVNAIKSLTGVTATDTKSDATGVTFHTADGRNIEVNYLSNLSATAFAQTFGVRQGVQIGSYSLATHHQQGLQISSSVGADIQHSGLQKGRYSGQDVASVRVNTGLIVYDESQVTSLRTGDLVINGVAIPASMATDDLVSHLKSPTSSRYASALSIAAAINSQKDKTHVTALTDPVVVEGNTLTHDYTGQAHLYINGEKIGIDLQAGDTPAARKQLVMDAINAVTLTGVTAYDNGTAGIALRAIDGRNVSLAYEKASDLNGAELNAAELGLGVLPDGESVVTDPEGLYAFDPVDTSFTDGPTLYASIVLQSGSDISIKPGANGYTADSHFSALGFLEREFSVQSQVKGRYYDPPRVARMNFQVGSLLGQSIDVYLPDFSDVGEITKEATWDVAMADSTRAGLLNVKQPVVDPNAVDPNLQLPTFYDSSKTDETFVYGLAKNPPVSTLQEQSSALTALGSLDTVLNNLSRARATLGAFVNRLEHSVSSLSDYYLNLSASRSQIEDTNYAQASSEMAKSQIMQQAATAILAQANTNQQTVLKLLQNMG
jgi:flagellin